ncbi:hypothetical protein PanWU01x14_113910 [Parasponia andersonii]|uniref:Uncharacterized protein n=1 Tax=Parasponia andersonii TaxID=3476 RepID=A0A2P5CXX2_PARAD|nr:hypothetical protein PanWU01x14_113910 [Parasponia andersonii]
MLPGNIYIKLARTRLFGLPHFDSSRLLMLACQALPDKHWLCFGLCKFRKRKVPCAPVAPCRVCFRFASCGELRMRWPGWQSSLDFACIDMPLCQGTS